MELVIDHKTSVLTGEIGQDAAKLALRLEGRKVWKAVNRLQLETSGHNIDVVVSLFPFAVVKDTRLSVEATKALDITERVPGTTPEPAFKLAPRDFQLENFHRFKDKLAWAIFSEQGTGKTKVAFDIISHRALKGSVTGVVILSSPKGVHAQWIEEQLPKHLWDNVPAQTYIWEGRKPPQWLGKQTNQLQIVSGNIDMVKSAGAELLDIFIKAHRAKTLIIVDESDSIKSLESSRSKRLRKLAEPTRQRGIMTGTPIAKDLTDEWAQFYFLDPDIIGHKYLTTFRSQFCLMGGFENRSVVGHRNVENFKRLTAPHIFRATKADLNLPPKVYDEVVFELGPTQRRLIRELRDQFFATVKLGHTVAVKNGISALLRIQQISNGYAVDENGVVTVLENPRLDALVDWRRQITGKVIIWCRFKDDVKAVKSAFHNSGVTYFGEDDSAGRKAAKEAFIEGDAQELIATPGAMGRGVDGLQRVCSTAGYYSNSYNAIDRWQSEDRIDRIGMIGTSSYFDFIARGSIDRAILANLKRKKDIASLALDDIMQIMEQVS